MHVQKENLIDRKQFHLCQHVSSGREFQSPDHRVHTLHDERAHKLAQLTLSAVGFKNETTKSIQLILD